MGKRARRRPATTSGATDHQARIRVDDEVWFEFRNSIVGPTSIAAYLGRMVEADVARNRKRRMRSDAAVAERELLLALDRAEATRAELDALVGRLERRLGPHR